VSRRFGCCDLSSLRLDAVAVVAVKALRNMRESRPVTVRTLKSVLKRSVAYTALACSPELVACDVVRAMGALTVNRKTPLRDVWNRHPMALAEAYARLQQRHPEKTIEWSAHGLGLPEAVQRLKQAGVLAKGARPHLSIEQFEDAVIDHCVILDAVAGDVDVDVDSAHAERAVVSVVDPVDIANYLREKLVYSEDVPLAECLDTLCTSLRGGDVLRRAMARGAICLLKPDRAGAVLRCTESLDKLVASASTHAKDECGPGPRVPSIKDVEARIFGACLEKGEVPVDELIQRLAKHRVLALETGQAMHTLDAPANRKVAYPGNIMGLPSALEERAAEHADLLEALSGGRRVDVEDKTHDAMWG
jgi:hypothetical protein